MHNHTPVPSREKEIYRITIVGSIVNILLTALKFIAGVLGASSAMIADAVHSLSDLLTDFVVLLFVKLSSRPADADHPYGHGKYDTFYDYFINPASRKSGIIWTE